MNQPIERWRPVAGTGGVYEVSDFGRVNSLPRASTRGGILRASKTPRGHLVVSLTVGGKQKSRLVHRVVAEAFIGPPPPGEEVRHLNGDPSDNRLPNLKYGTRSANVLDQVVHGVHNNARKTHCKNGHEFTRENTMSREGGRRRCRACNAASQAKYNARRAAKTGDAP